MRLYLIRHAQSANNVIYDGTDNTRGRVPDPELTDNGHLQCQHLANHLATPGNEPRQHPFDHTGAADYGLTHIYCSLMSRAIVTADYVARACSLPIHAHMDLFEHLGLYRVDDDGRKEGVEGPNREYFQRRFPDLQLPEELGQRGWWNRPLETDEQFTSRATRMLNWVMERHGRTDDRVALVSHWGFLDQLINEITNTQFSKDHYRRNPWSANWVLDNTSVSRIDFGVDTNTVIYLNRLSHLPVDLVVSR